MQKGMGPQKLSVGPIDPTPGSDGHHKFLGSVDLIKQAPRSLSFLLSLVIDNFTPIYCITTQKYFFPLNNNINSSYFVDCVCYDGWWYFLKEFFN